MELHKLFHLLYLLGVIIWQYESVDWIVQSVKTRLCFSRNLGRFTDSEGLEAGGRVARHIRLLLEGSESGRLFPTVEGFFLFCGSLFVVSFLLLRLIVQERAACLWAVFLAALPYFLLQVRLHERRVERSKEGDILVQELLNNYRIYDFNMQEAVEKTAMSMEGAPLGRRLYLQLAKGLQNAVTKREVENLLSSFRYSFGTAWGNVLASNILFGYLYGIRVDEALNDLLRCMVQSRKAVEYGRRENHEAKLMLLYLAPVSFLLSVFTACRFFDFTLKKFFLYQFGMPLGMQWFMTFVFCYVLSLILQRVLAKEKMDI